MTPNETRQNSTEFDTISKFNLSPAQATVVTQLARGCTVTRAARQAGVHRATVYHWFQKESQFAAAVHEAQRENVARLADSVRELSDLAIHTISGLLHEPNTSSAVRLKAALAVLERGRPAKQGWTLPDFRVETPPEQILFGPPEPPASHTAPQLEAAKEATPPRGAANPGQCH